MSERAEEIQRLGRGRCWHQSPEAEGVSVFKEQLPPKKVEYLETEDESGEVENGTYVPAPLLMTLQSPELTVLLGYF